DRLVLAPRALERFLAPRIPVDGVVGVLQQVRAGRVDQPIGVAVYGHGARAAFVGTIPKRGARSYRRRFREAGALLHNPAMLAPDIVPVAFTIGPLKVHWYGLMYLVGFLGGWALGAYRAGKPGSGWRRAEIGDLLFYLALGTII